MKRFLLKTAIMLFCLAVLFFLNVLLINKTDDLSRIGFLYQKNLNNKNNDVVDVEKGSQRLIADSCSFEAFLNENNSVDMLLIGDSFTPKLAKAFSQKGLSVVGIYTMNNPLLIFKKLSRCNWFERHKKTPVIVETIQRNFVKRVEQIDDTRSIDFPLFSYNCYPSKQHPIGQLLVDLKYYSNSLFWAPINNMKCLIFDDCVLGRDVCKAKAHSLNPFFGERDLFFYGEDTRSEIFSTERKSEAIEKFFIEIDNLNNTGVVVRGLIIPDKFTAQYGQIIHKNKYPSPENTINLIETKSKLILFPIDCVTPDKRVFYLDYDTHLNELGYMRVVDYVFNNIDGLKL